MFRWMNNFGVLLIAAVLMSGCVDRMQPIYDAYSVSIPEKLRFVPMSEIESAIIQGGNREGWLMETVTPGKIKGTLNIRNHQAVVDIIYTTAEYSITYASSKNLLSSNSGIHRNYNIWVRELETSINSSLDKMISARTTQEAPAVNTAENAWRLIEDSKDPKEYLLFLEKYGDSAYAPAAVRRLNEIVDGGGMINHFDPLGKWRVTASYKAIRGSSSWCVKKRNWEFEQSISISPGKLTVWHRETALYLDTTYIDNRVHVNIIVPDGGSKWKWNKPLVLDKKRKDFTAESVTGGGSYSSCLGELTVKMEKVS